MMETRIYTLTSRLHDEKAVGAATREFLDSLNVSYVFRGDDYADYGSQGLDLIFVRTGGTENIFRQLLPQLRSRSTQPFYLLASGKSNSLAASMEILSFLNQQGIRGEILHGQPAYIAHRIHLLSAVCEGRGRLSGSRMGIIGSPSDWLISSTFDRKTVSEQLGIDLHDIPMEELLQEIVRTNDTPSPEQSPRMEIRQALPMAENIYQALKKLVGRHHLKGLTIRCFDLLSAVKNTGCLGLARLNAEGVVAGCEGDVPAMLSMAIAQALTGETGFQANPASIDPETGEILFAHCTIPLNMVERYELDTHFESSIGVGIRGYVKEGPVTIFKTSGDLSRHFIAEGMLVRNQANPNLCRTQQVVQLADKDQTAYFQTHPIGNHHIILRGHHRELLEEFLLEKQS